MGYRGYILCHPVPALTAKGGILLSRKRYEQRDQGFHLHLFQNLTTIDDGHLHGMFNVTSVERDTRNHRHNYEGRTTINRGHDHRYRGRTGEPIQAAGGHYHRYRGETSVTDRHDHDYQGTTSVWRSRNVREWY